MIQNDNDFFDKIATSWDSITQLDSVKINHILDVANLKDGETVLDVGTGTGVLVPFILNRIGVTGQIDALDISKGMLEVAKKKFGHLQNVNFMLSDVETEVLQKQYDCIMMYCMYPHLKNGEDTVEWLVKLNLLPKGRLIIAFPESKDRINGLHHHNDGSVHSTHLLDANMMKARFAASNLNVDYIEDSDEYYIIRIAKE